jgi:hypothetical protein
MTTVATDSRVIRAAGVLLYSRDAAGNVWFLLGREKPNPHWGVDSCSWSEFGGSLDGKESVEEGAAREFFEETMGSVFSAAWMEDELKRGRYTFAMDSRTPYGRGYRSFVKYIPFADYPTKFAKFKIMAKKFPQHLQQLSPECFRDGTTLIPSCMEKTSMWWFNETQLRRAVDKYKLERHNPYVDKRLELYDEPNMIPHLRRGFAMDLDFLLSTPWAQRGFKEDRLNLSISTTPQMKITTTTTPTLATPTFATPTNACSANAADKVKRSGQLTASSNGRRPILLVEVDGYSFKKRKRKRKDRHTSNSVDFIPKYPL